MKKRLNISCYFIFLCFIGCFSAPLFISSFIKDLNAMRLDSFEIIARAIGYLLVFIINAFTAFGAYRLSKGTEGRRFFGIALLLSLITVIVLCIHDVLFYCEYGNNLEGTFTMTMFFVLDAALLILYIVSAVGFFRGLKKHLIRIVSVAIILIWIIYMVGDMLGYPVSQITDWDEAMLKFLPMCSVIGLLFV